MFSQSRNRWLAQMVGIRYIPPFVFSKLEKFFANTSMNIRLEKSPTSSMLGSLRTTNPVLVTRIYSPGQHRFTVVRSAHVEF